MRNTREGPTPGGRLLLFSILGGSSIFFLPISTAPFTMPRQWLLQLAACIGIVWFAARKSGRLFRTGDEALLLFAFAGWSLLCGLVNLDRGLNRHAFLEQMITYGTLAVIFLLGRALAPTGRRRAGFSCLAGATAGLLAVTGLAQFWGYNPLPSPDLSGRMSVYSFSGNPNYLACALACLTPLFLYYGMRGKKRLRTALVGVVLILAVMCLAITRSRGGWLAFGAALAVFSGIVVWHRRSGWRRVMIVGGFLLLGLGIVSMLYGTRLKLGRRVRSVLDPSDPNIQKRLLMWRLTGYIFRKNPVFGTGPGGLRDHYFEHQRAYFQDGNEEQRKYATTPSHIHNDYLEVAAESGLVGITLLLGFLLACLRRGLAVETADEDADEVVWRAGLAASAAACLTHALVSSPLHIPTSQAVLFLVLGMMTYRIHRKLEISRKWGIALKSAVIAAAVLALSVSVRHAAANLLISNTLDVLHTGDPDENIRRLRTARRYDPYNAMIPYYLAQLHTKLGEFQTSLDLYERSSGLRTNYMAHFNRGSLYTRFDKWAEAAAEFSAALGYYPRLGDAAYHLGIVSELQGSLQEAELAFTRAVRDTRYPVPEAVFRLGNVKAATGQSDEAVRRYTEYITWGNNEIRGIQRRVTEIMGGAPTGKRVKRPYPREVIRSLRRQNVIARHMDRAGTYIKSQGIEPPWYFKAPQIRQR